MKQQGGTPRPGPGSRVDELISRLERQAPAGRLGLEVVRAWVHRARTTEDWAHAAHAALRQVPRGLVVTAFEADNQAMELIGELELAFGDLPEASSWPAAAHEGLLRLAAHLLVEAWEFQAPASGAQVRL